MKQIQLNRRGTGILCLVLCAAMLLTAPAAQAAVPDYETRIALGLIEEYDAGADRLALDAAADWNMSLGKTLELIGTVVPRCMELEMQGDNRFVTFTARPLYQATNAELEQTARQVLDTILTPGMTDREKLFAMYQWIILNTSYDASAAMAGYIPASEVKNPWAYSPAGPLYYGAAVCDGYSRLMLLFCRMEGIPCVRVSSFEIIHSFNAVWLEGEWLLLDATWDDPDYGTTVYTDYFLKPKSELQGHRTDSGAGDTLSYEDIIAFGESYYADLIAQKRNPSPFYGLSYSEMADMLYDQGLFLGTELGYELDRGLTRAELAVLFVRILGLEQEAYAAPVDCPFTDLPEWAAPHISLLYSRGLTNGMAPTLYGSDSLASGRDYATFLLRAMNYVEGLDFRWESATEAAQELGFSPSKSVRPETGDLFLRADAVEMTVRAMRAPMAASPQTLAEHLAQLGVLDTALAEQQGLLK